jgi:hypothetical protein
MLSLCQANSLLIFFSLNRLVLETLDPVPRDRKCFRLINGVLVERTVEDVIPALKTNAEGLRKVLDDLVKQYKLKQDELDRWKVGTPSAQDIHPSRIPCLAFGSLTFSFPLAEKTQHPSSAELISVGI